MNKRAKTYAVAGPQMQDTGRCTRRICLVKVATEEFVEIFE